MHLLDFHILPNSILEASLFFKKFLKNKGAVAIAGAAHPLTLQKLFEKWALRQIFCKTKHSF